MLSACASFEDSENDKNTEKINSTPQRIFFASYDKVWRATQAALHYPIAAQNEETGYLETDFIRGIDGWIAPEQKPPSFGISYRLLISFVRGKTEGRESTRVTINKKIMLKRDFVSEPKDIVSDGLEEEVLFYRIERELVIYEALRKANL